MKLISPCFVLVYLLGYLNAGLFPDRAYAEITSNDNWTIEVKDLSLTTDPAVNNQKKQLINDQPMPGSYSGTNYTIKTGYENLPPSKPFSFNISNSIIDYGPLSPTNHIYRTSNLNVSNTSTKRFIVIAYENRPLVATESNSSIPDSTCDNGSCSQVRSALWTNTLTYGFGYRCDNVSNNDCPIDFNLDNYYKQFSDQSKKETEQIIMSSNLPESNHETQITYKVNISKTQPKDSYSNTVTYIAVPGY